MALALEELAFFSVHLRMLGTYPAHPFRAEIAEPAANRTLRPNPPALTPPGRQPPPTSIPAVRGSALSEPAASACRTPTSRATTPAAKPSCRASSRDTLAL